MACVFGILFIATGIMYDTITNNFNLKKPSEAIVEQKRLAELQRQKEEQRGSVPAKETKRDNSFIAYDNGTVLDTKNNLMWAAKDNGYEIS